MVVTRPASFSGSWYPNDGIGVVSLTLTCIANSLRTQLGTWLQEAQLPKVSGRAKIVIAPHAGYRYSGSTAAHSFKILSQKRWKRVILLGPSHRAHLRSTCELCPFDAVQTPLGTIKVTPINGLFLGSTSIDSKEHSLEIQFPFIKYTLPEAEVIPILVGNIGSDFQSCAEKLAQLLSDDDTALVISSDFCHWGLNYSYSLPLEAYPGSSFSERIAALDREALQCIECGGSFSEYLERTRNTICGRNPIILGLEVIKLAGLTEGSWEWLSYSQSNQIRNYNPSESSVSYVAGAFIIDQNGGVV